MPTLRPLLPLLLVLLGGAAWAQGTAPVAYPNKTVTYFDADDRPLPGPAGADHWAEVARYDSVRAVVRRYYAAGALQEYTPYLDLPRGVVHGTRTTWYENGQLRTKEEYVGGQRQGELLAYYPDGTLKRRDTFAAGQNLPGACYDPEGRPVPYFPFEQPPLYPGGALLLYHDVTRRVRPSSAEMRQFAGYGFAGLPADGAAADRWPVGEIDVAFTVTERGEVADPYVARSTAPWLDEKVLAAVRGITKRFRPGVRDGQLVRTSCRVPVVFYVAVPGRRIRRGGGE
ncbi:energy transducer TonB [Hymenobacter caeli]|uniref:TonB C-terminal domain-containing protein n=1 Tax=Hymenobacter caeli TaxID=2735894 RepID=A0ABX2FV14_9BACT|nr:energy transducer TonB [Hymenobacter caeli]NRT21042.1 hypothetical protein [Hymenobacter caeli]